MNTRIATARVWRTLPANRFARPGYGHAHGTTAKADLGMPWSVASQVRPGAQEVPT